MQNLETITLDTTFDVRHRLQDLAVWQEATQAQIKLIDAQVAATDVNISKSEIQKAVQLNVWGHQLKRQRVKIPLELRRLATKNSVGIW